MLLADSSIWIDHLRAPDPKVEQALRERRLLIHPLVIGELSMGSIKDRDVVLAQLGALRTAKIASHAEVVGLVTRERLFGLEIGFIDAHLIASALLTPGARLWTRDKRLARAAERLGVAAG